MQFAADRWVFTRPREAENFGFPLPPGLTKPQVEGQALRPDEPHDLRASTDQKNGSSGRTRTHNPPVNSHSFCPLAILNLSA